MCLYQGHYSYNIIMLSIMTIHNYNNYRDMPVRTWQKLSPVHAAEEGGGRSSAGEVQHGRAVSENSHTIIDEVDNAKMRRS